MSIIREQELICPFCGNTQEITLCDSINVTLDPELKNKLFASEINLFDCKGCKKKSFIDIPLFYHDMEKQFCVQYYPVESLNDTDFYCHFNVNGFIDLSTLNIPEGFFQTSEYLTKPHIIFTPSEMLRYIMFRDGIFLVQQKVETTKTRGDK